MGTVGREDDALAGTLGPDGCGGDATVDADPLAATMAGADQRDLGATPITAGTRVGRYVVRGPLGAGGMGVVYAAHDPDLDRPVALKLLRPELNTARTRLIREGQAIARLRHPNLVTVHDIGIHAHELFIAMELVDGTTLGAWMREGPDRRRPWREVLARLVPAGRGLAAAHAAGLIHRDFKPENVLLGTDGRVVVTDFGLAQLGDVEPSSGETPRVAAGAATADATGGAAEGAATPVTVAPLTRTGAVLGTPAYMSPEQFRGERPDARSDQFSFCVSVYEALYGRRPFDPRDGSTPSLTGLASAVTDGRLAPLTAGSDTPRWLRRALARGLRPEPSARWASMEDLLEALRPPRRARVLVAIAAGLALAVLAAVVVLARRGDGALVAGARACDGPAAELDALWNDEARARYRTRHAGRPWLDEELGWLDAYARHWSARRRQGCQRAGAEAPADPCLGAARAALVTAIDRAHDEWPELPALAACDRPTPVATAFPLAIGVGPQGVAQLSPDGQRLVVSDLGDEPYVIAADPASFTPVPVAGAYLVGDWLDDGTLVAQRADRSLYLTPATGGPGRALPGRGDQLHTQINVTSADGAYLAVQEDDAVVVLDAVDGARLHVVAGPAHELAWEPDGRRLAIVSRDLHVLRLLDVRTGTLVAMPIRLHTRGLGEIGAAWLAPGRLLLSGSADPGGTYGVFELVLDEASRLRRAPTQRWRASAAMMVRLFDAAGGRILLELATSRQRMFRWHAGVNEELSSTFVGLRLAAIDRVRGEALAFGPGQLVRFDVARLTRTVLPGADFVLPALHDGAAMQVVARSRGAWSLVELRADGTTRDHLGFAWPIEHGVPHLRCSPLDTRRCVLASRDGRTLHVAALGPRGPGTPIVIDDPSWNPDVARDGRHVLVATVQGDLRSVDVVTGAATTVTHIDPACRMRTVRWIDDGPRAWVVLLCPDRFAIGSVGPGESFTEVVRSDGWISGVEAVDGGGFLYSVMDWDPQLVLVDGL